MHRNLQALHFRSHQIKYFHPLNHDELYPNRVDILNPIEPISQIFLLIILGIFQIISNDQLYYHLILLFYLTY